MTFSRSLVDKNLECRKEDGDTCVGKVNEALVPVVQGRVPYRQNLGQQWEGKRDQSVAETKLQLPWWSEILKLTGWSYNCLNKVK